jgi:branched-chain amino acid transport system substrate-binding protein
VCSCMMEGQTMVRARSLFVSITLIAALGATTAAAEVLIGVAGPMTGKDAWFGEQLQRGAELAVADLNAAGGVLGEQLQLITADDFCDPEQAVAAARKLVSDGVVFVVGHYCSHSSIPASEVYEAAGVLQISPASTNPLLTELGRANVFRVVNRDDANGVVVGKYLADHWSDKKIAILHDDTTYGKGVADEVKKNLNRRGLTEAIYQAYVPGQAGYGAEIAELQAADIAVVFIGGYHTEIGLMARQARDRGYGVQLVAANSMGTEDFRLIAGAAGEGTLFTDPADPRSRADAAPVVERFRASGFEPEGYTLYTYGAVQVWAQAAEQAGSLELQAMIRSLRQHQFDTLLGSIQFDDKGDLTVQSPVLYVWHADGTYVPVESNLAEN